MLLVVQDSHSVTNKSFEGSSYNATEIGSGEAASVSRSGKYVENLISICDLNYRLYHLPLFPFDSTRCLEAPEVLYRVILIHPFLLVELPSPSPSPAP